MPFDKGDFTQQGVAGDVSALVRLNEKRVMKVVLSSDDESDNCDISGAVYDLLNEEVYPIGAGVSGNIEITENGENINVAPYATATVNVAGGGGEQTETFTLIPENDYTSELSNNDNLIFGICMGMFAAVYTSQIIVNINNTDVVFTPISEGSNSYRSANNEFELSTSFGGGYLLVPTAGTYHVKSNITLTGPTITVKQGEAGIIRAFLDNDIYEYLFLLGPTGEIDIIADGLIPFSGGQ